MRYISPAKINLFLRVIERRPDNYHELASLFQTIDLCDTIDITLSNSDLLTCTDPTLPTDSSNLVMKAVNLFRQKTGLKFGVKAHLEKHIPHQAGLGGGSSNAATTLWALNQLCGYPATTEELAAWSAEIGSDISFFFAQGTAYCTGRGEHVENLPSLPQTTLWIVKPSQGLSTPLVYQNLHPKELPQRQPKQMLQQFFNGTPYYFNDLEQAAFSVMPALATLKQKLTNVGFSSVVMTGSGSGFFCIGSKIPPVDATFFCRQVKFLNRETYNWYTQ
ncbi:MAG: 4-(cytidine 5'-diphospho)-2-C-methyl-D-erythritol kinase [Parachlamydiaceae bacterium]|nr:4-(cytidine 5'-diphospho)-2-C-methyl-D-erythritol kinase [Parachlamydiaceae bacterium]